MKRHVFLLTVLLSCSWQALADAEIGKPAPPILINDINNRTQQLSDYKGKIVVIESINLDCPFCANHYKSGAMPELQAELTGKGVVWFTINSSNPKSPSSRSEAAAKKEFAEQKMRATSYILDSNGKIGRAYGLLTTPHLIVIDQKGLIAYNGAIDDLPDSDVDPRKAKTNYVRDAVESLLQGAPVKEPRTKSYGCGIKY
jgi:peroxiredoxin